MDTMEPIYWRRTNWKGNGWELSRNWNQMKVVTNVEDMVGSHNG